jgi:hypothetical protein
MGLSAFIWDSFDLRMKASLSKVACCLVCSHTWLAVAGWMAEVRALPLPELSPGRYVLIQTLHRQGQE